MNAPVKTETGDANKDVVSHGEEVPIATGETAAPGSVQLEANDPGDDDEGGLDEETLTLMETFEGMTERKEKPDVEATPAFNPDPDLAQTPPGGQQVQSSGQPPTEGHQAQAAPPVGTAQGEQVPQQGQQQAQGNQQPQVAGAEGPGAETRPQATQPQQPIRSLQDSFAELRQSIEAQKPKVVDSVAQELYNLTEDEQNMLATEPEKVLPKMAARVHVNAVTSVLTQISQRLPGMVLSLMQMQKVHEEAENKFWTMNPALKRDTDQAVVLDLMSTYRAKNPNATFEQVAKNVGAMAIVALGRHIQPQAAVPAQPVTQRAPARAAFQPAGNGQAAPSKATPQYASEWDRTLAGMEALDAMDS